MRQTDRQTDRQRVDPRRREKGEDRGSLPPRWTRPTVVEDSRSKESHGASRRETDSTEAVQKTTDRGEESAVEDRATSRRETP